MDIRELEDFKLSDAVKFHNELNPNLWENNKLKPEVKDQLLKIANDFILELGVAIPKIKDITISGSNAAYSYTPYSDLDLHILIDFNELSDDEIYQELFTAKKNLYNEEHDIEVYGVSVELYVQDSNQKHVSLGEYSIVNDDWIRIPKKQKANFDQEATKAKFEKLGSMIELALKSNSLEKVEKVLDVLKRYRQAGLSNKGEFGPENLSYKALRNLGYIQKLYDYKNQLHSKDLSLEDYHPNAKPPGPEFPPTMPSGTIRVDVSDVYDWYKLGQHISDMEGLGKHDFGQGPPSTILSFGDEDLEHKYIDALKKTGLDTTDIDPKGHEPLKGQKVDPTYNVNEILDKESASNLSWNEGESNELYNTYIATAKDKKNNILKYNFYEFPKYDLTAIEFSRAVGPWGDNYSIDKAGDQYTVFATLLQAIKNYLSSDKPEYIFFAAKEPSRVKLYQTFVNRFANQFGYKQISADNIPRAVSFTLYSSNDTPFVLQKVGSKEIKESVKFIEGTNCKNCVWWKKDSEKPVGKDELNKYGGLKPPNKEYIAMSKRVDLVTLPGKDTVKEKGFCYHKDINDWVTERMCCAKWDGEGVIRDYKGESPLMESKAEAVRKIQKFLNKKYDANLDVDGILGPLTLQSINKFMPKAKKASAPEPDKTTAIQGKEVKEASGYIPSEKEKNDPRFKTALTVDVKPDSIKKNAKAFGWDISRTGRPPLLRK